VNYFDSYYFTFTRIANACKHSYNVASVVAYVPRNT